MRKDGEQQRMTVRCRLCYQISGDIAAGARPIVDNYGLSPRFSETASKCARDEIRVSTRWKGD